jgi:hypothetical protein
MLDQGWKTVTSQQDAVRLISSVVTANVDIKPELEKTDFVKELATMANLFISSSSVSETERLVNALTSTSSESPTGQCNFALSGNVLAVRIPSYDKSNTGQTDNLGKYLRWAVTILGLKDPEVKILPDEKLGNAIILPAKIERMMDTTLASLSLPTESGDRADFKSGLKGNLTELLAATKLMRKYQGSLQKLPAPKGQKAVVTSQDDLRKSVNGRSGLNEHGLPSFTAIFVKSVFNEITKPSYTRFPGKWMNSLRVTNGTKSNIGVMYKLGYECTTPSAQKVISVVRTAIKEKKSDKTSSTKRANEETPRSKAKFELVVQTKDNTPDGISHREFRLAAFLLLPLINPKAKESPKDQISVDPLTVRSKTITGFYKEHRDVVDAVNLAYATKSAIGKKNSKATPLGYESARGHAISLTANRMWQDANGVKYTKLMDVPEHIRNFLLSFFHRKLVEEDTDSEAEEAEAEEEFTTPKKE